MNVIKRIIPLLILTALIVSFLPVQVFATTIDVGPGATNRASSAFSAFTVIDLANPANATGTLETVEVWFATGPSAARIGIFYLISGTTYKCRSSTADLGAVTSGSKQTYSVSLSINAGDYIGVWFNGGGIEQDTSGGSGVMAYSGEAIDVNDQASYTSYASRAISVYGYTETTEPPTVSTSDASSVSYTTATLNGNLSDLGSGASVAVSFEYGLTASYGSTAVASESPMSGTGTFHADISSLDDGTTYHFRAKADGDGDPVYGDDLTFTTDSQSPSITTSAATDVTMDKDGVTGGTFNGEITDLGDSSNVTVSFEYGLGDFTEETGLVSKNATGIFNINIPSNLTPGQTYQCRSKATNEYGTSYGASTNVSFTMPTFTTEEADYTSPGSASATLNGNISNLGVASNCSVKFEYGYDTGYGTTTLEQIMGGIGDFEQAISSFLRNVTIHFRAILTVGNVTVNGSDETFLIAPPDLSGILWYQPVAIIEGNILPDLAENEDGIITWGTALNATFGSFGPVNPRIPTITSNNTTLGIVAPDPIPGMYTEGTYPWWAGAINAVLDAAGVPRMLFWIFLVTILSIIGCFLAYYISTGCNLNERPGEVWALPVGGGIVWAMFSLMSNDGVSVTGGLVPFWPVFLWIFLGLVLFLMRERIHV